MKKFGIVALFTVLLSMLGVSSYYLITVMKMIFEILGRQI